MKVKLERVHLKTPCDLERGMAMSTLIHSEEMRLEADYLAGCISDVRIYRNMDPNDVIKEGEHAGERRKGPYWGSVPQVLVKCYRFLDGEPNAGAEKEGRKGKSVDDGIV